MTELKPKKKFRYEFVVVPVNYFVSDECQDTFNQLGSDGWRLVTVHSWQSQLHFVFILEEE